MSEEAGPDSSQATGNGRDRFVPSVGFVIAGFGLASGFLRWTEAVAVGPVESLPGVLAGLVALLAFGARRHGIENRQLSILAALGAGSLAWAAAVAFLYPAATGSEPVSVGVGVPLAFTLGILGVGVAYADYRGLGRGAFLDRAQQATSALGIGVSGLFVGILVGMAIVAAVPTSNRVLQQGLSTAGFSIGLGVVAIVFLVLTENDLSYIDLGWFSRRDWGYAIGGVVAMYGILFGLSVLFSALGIPSTQHGLIEAARDNPEMLLLFIPLSFVAIGPGEELLNRNIIQKYLYESYSRYSAVVVATVVFTLIHLPAYATGTGAEIFSTLIRLFAISLVLGIVYERTENVIVSAVVHGTYDAIQFGLAYVALTGGYI